MRRQRVGHVLPSLARFARSLRRNRSGRETCQGPLRETLERGRRLRDSCIGLAQTPKQAKHAMQGRPQRERNRSQSSLWESLRAMVARGAPLEPRLGILDPSGSLLGASWGPPELIFERCWNSGTDVELFGASGPHVLTILGPPKLPPQLILEPFGSSGCSPLKI